MLTLTWNLFHNKEITINPGGMIGGREIKDGISIFGLTNTNMNNNDNNTTKIIKPILVIFNLRSNKIDIVVKLLGPHPEGHENTLKHNIERKMRGLTMI